MQVYFKSLPRSGHHFLSTMVYQYFGDEIKYCYKAEICCCRAPCAMPGPQPHIMHKSHDSNLSDPKDVPGIRYVVQVREPLGRLASEIDRAKNRTGNAFPIENPDFAEYWLAGQLVYERDFRQRWLTPPPVAGIVLDYSDLLQEPQAALCKVIRLFDQEPDMARVTDIVASNRNRSARNPAKDHWVADFKPRDATATPALPPDLLADLLGFLRQPDPTTRLARLQAVIASLSQPEPDLVGLSKAVVKLRNAVLARQVRKQLIAAGLEPEAIALRKAFS